MKETITIAVDVELKYDNDDGRDYLLSYARNALRIDMQGWGKGEKGYSAKSKEGSARIIEDKPERV